MNLIKTQLISIVLGLFLLTHSSCSQNSETHSDKSAGINGSFETLKNGVPVNWQLYSLKTLPNASFEITLDTTDSHEGVQSLKLDVSRCDSAGGWKSPGLASEFIEARKFEGPQNYRLSFWIKSSGVHYLVKAGGVSAKKGKLRVLEDSRQIFPSWKGLHYDLRVEEGQWLRFELNVLSPGQFWIDDFRIEKL